MISCCIDEFWMKVVSNTHGQWTHFLKVLPLSWKIKKTKKNNITYTQKYKSDERLDRKQKQKQKQTKSKPVLRPIHFVEMGPKIKKEDNKF